MAELLDNRAHRIRTLKRIIRSLHEGGPEARDGVREELKRLVGETDSTEIAAMEQELIRDGMGVDAVRSMCDLHAEVLREVLVEPPRPEVPPGHPVDTFRRENQALRNVLAEMRAAADAARQAPGPEAREAPLQRLREAHAGLMEIEKHYRRKENVLFPRLEAHGITGPSQVMWAKHDEIRAMLKELGARLKRDDPEAGDAADLSSAAEAAAAAVESMFAKEEDILLPMALATLTEEEWGDIWRDSPEFGWCLVEPRAGYSPPEPAEPPPAVELPEGSAIRLPSGSLTRDELLGVFSALPVDVTFVDADDRVRFFSEGKERVFERSRAIIGRKVEHCHPPKSVHIVEKIIDDFRSGRQDVAEFWIRMNGRFVHIRYFAVRDPENRYLGTLEVTQDLTRLRALEGERRLLEYDKPDPKAS